MVRALWIAGLATALAQAQEGDYRTSVFYDTSPSVIDEMNSTLAVTPSVLHPDSALLSLNATGLYRRRAIDVIVAAGTVVIAGGTVIIAGSAALDIYDNVARKIKAKSDANSCTLTYGTDGDDGYYEGYAYLATTTGSNCDTTAIFKTIQKAVQSCATKLSEARAVQGCCKFSHGGTWTGHLRLTGNPRSYPATSVNC